MKKRTYSLCTLGLAALLGTILFLTSEKVQRAEKEFNILRDKVRSEQDSLRVLRAEWTYLNRPDRLEQLTATHLKLAPVAVTQMTSSLASIPAHVTPTAKPAIVPASIEIIVPPTPTKPAVAPAVAKAAPKPTPAARTPKDGNTQTFYQMLNRTANTPARSNPASKSSQGGTFYDR